MVNASSRLPLRRDPLFWMVWGSYLAVGGLLLFIVPGFIDVYEQVDVPMPRLTIIVGWVSVFARQFPWIWILGTLVVARAITRLPLSEAQREWAKGLTFLGLVIHFGTALVGITLPLMGLLEEIEA